MVTLRCPYCKQPRQIEHKGAEHRDKDTSELRIDRFNIVLICCVCQRRSVYGVEDNSIVFNPERTFDEDLASDVHELTREMFDEALLCFYGTSFRGTVAMCRSSVEAALESKNVAGRDLYHKITNAKESKILGDEQVSHAHLARLYGRDALHHMKNVSQSQAQLILGATVQILNHIAQQETLPASPSVTGNSAE